MIIHYLKTALRHLLQYKLQIVISVASMAVGMVTLSTIHMITQQYSLPPICNEPYYQRACLIEVDSLWSEQSESEHVLLNQEIIRALNHDGHPACTEGRITATNSFSLPTKEHFYLGDSLVRIKKTLTRQVDPALPVFIGLHSAVTGEKIDTLRRGDAIVSEAWAREVFGKTSPVGMTFTHWLQGGESIVLTIADVYETPPMLEHQMRARDLLFASDYMENMNFGYWYVTFQGLAVLKDGYTPEQLRTEADARLKPLGLKTKVTPMPDHIRRTYENVIKAQWLVHLIGSLILLAAFIGFMKTQLQLFRIRQREISLRIAAGARRRQLFWMLMTEISIVIAWSILAALGLGVFMEGFFKEHLTIMTEDMTLDFGYLYHFSLLTGGVMLLIGGCLVGVTLLRICKTNQDLASSLRHSRSHRLRNTLLLVQMVISMVFVCCTLDLLDACNTEMATAHIPANTQPYEESLIIHTDNAQNPEQLKEALTMLPEVKQTIYFRDGHYGIDNIAQKPEYKSEFNDLDYFHANCIPDTAFLHFFQADIRLFSRKMPSTGVLIHEDFYKKMNKLNLIPNHTLTINYPQQTLPIIGTFKNVAYEKNGINATFPFMLIDPEVTSKCKSFILEPLPGRHKALREHVDATIEELEPIVADPIVDNTHRYLSREIDLDLALRNAGCILALVSLVICIMGIHSAIAMDVRSRKKEVAIRKINGAKAYDIGRLFGRVYVILFLLSAIITVPVALWFHNELLYSSESYFQPDNNNMAALLIGGIALVGIIMGLIVGRYIHLIMHLQPSNLISKE